MIVADANVILYALTPGELTSAAREALERADGVAVPVLWRLEVANALAVIVRRDLLTPEQATEVFAARSTPLRRASTRQRPMQRSG